MIKYNANPAGSIVVAIILLMIISCQLAFGQEKKFEISPYMDFNGSIHGGIGNHYDGFAASVGAGAEVLYVVNDNFAFGANGKTNLNYDNYLQDGPDDDMLVDEYEIGRASCRERV